MFGKAQWAIVGLNPESLDAFRVSIIKTPVLFDSSQLVAFTRAKFGNVDTVGINPFNDPRKDEGRELGITPHYEELYTSLKNENVVTEDYRDYYGDSEVSYRISPDMPWYGFWFVLNTQEDVSDLNSIREHLSYTKMSRPYKYTGKDDKKTVDSMAQGWAEQLRTQFPVLLDFHTGRVYIQNSNQDNILAVLNLIKNLGVETYPLMWQFGDADWVTKFLNNKTSGALYVEEIGKRAEEIRTFTGGELAIIEDPSVAKIVEKYFSVQDPGTGLQMAFSPTATATLYPGGSPITVANPSDLVNLEHANDKMVINTARVTFQEIITHDTKKGTKIYRFDLFTFDINPNCTLWDAGAALIRGFDIPNFKRTIMKEIRKTKQEQAISYFYSQWLRLMNEGIHTLVDNIATVLELDRTNGSYGLIEAGNEIQEEVVHSIPDVARMKTEINFP